MTKKNSQPLLRKITHIEALIRLIKDDFLREQTMPNLNTINSIISELESLSELDLNQNIGSIN